MTPEEINRIIAEKCMGWEKALDSYWWVPSAIPTNGPDSFDPYHRIDHAMMVAQKVNLFRRGYLHQLVTNEWCVASKETLGKYLGKAATPSAAISLAIVEACKEEKGC